jgi:hypothetical protein
MCYARKTGGHEFPACGRGRTRYDTPDTQKLQALVRQPKAPTLTQQFELKCRKASETDFGSTAFGIAAFADANNNCTVYISETGAIAAVARR